MRVDEYCSPANKTFKALYISNSIFCDAYHSYDKMINSLKPKLTEHAQNVDIYVKNNGKMVDITVGQVVESPLKRFLHLIGATINKSIRADYRANDFAASILNNVCDAKQEYLKYQAYFTH